jgi:hypothetical protein
MEEITGAAVPKSLMENLLGLLRVRIKRGVNLAVRDVRSSDPYLVLKMYNQVIFIFLHHHHHKKLKIQFFFLYLLTHFFIC